MKNEKPQLIVNNFICSIREIVDNGEGSYKLIIDDSDFSMVSSIIITYYTALHSETLDDLPMYQAFMVQGQEEHIGIFTEFTEHADENIPPSITFLSNGIVD